MIETPRLRHLFLYQYYDYLRRPAVLNSILSRNDFEFITLMLLVTHNFFWCKSLIITFEERYVKKPS